ncbi:DeoR/GlpR family DNA-binding transcription regulator [Staphylococcus haemolyticus]|uniref:DeoR/GlpR family DNA-binding transcription regulator n=1 Tax=Staphylococcus haemolyticus TaxID=1283 RepID=UPI00265C841D|nr:DeoR/GlpR family DNA-binding transcription regulator [Staphylococcus haemolyticus]MDO0962415.1 DeoR/GlpR family DNA-binding transcription regulator [Staphylococcus haemolyticus]
MVRHERQNEILKMLRETRTVKIARLSDYFNVSRETIRKDIYDLEEEGLIEKVHGGAILNKANNETNYLNRKNENDNEKRAIAKEASRIIENGDTLYIDYGTTASYFINEILNKKDLTIITASIPLASELVDYTDFDVILLGGLIRKNEKSLYGPITQEIIENLYVDYGVYSGSGIDIEKGLTNFHMGESKISKEMISHCKRKLLLVDYSKFHTTAMNKIAEVTDFDYVITDDKTATSTILDLEEKVKKVIVVHGGSDKEND